MGNVEEIKESRVTMWNKHGMKMRFILVGIWNTIFGYFVFVLLDSLFGRFMSNPYAAYMTAAVLSNVLAITNAFFSHKRITFRSLAQGKEAWKEYARFFSTYLFSFFLSLLLLPFFVEFFLIPAKISAAIVILLCVVISYLGHKQFSFRYR